MVGSFACTLNGRILFRPYFGSTCPDRVDTMMRRGHKTLAFAALCHIQQVPSDLSSAVFQLVDRIVPAGDVGVPIHLCTPCCDLHFIMQQ